MTTQPDQRIPSATVTRPGHGVGCADAAGLFAGPKVSRADGQMQLTRVRDDRRTDGMARHPGRRVLRGRDAVVRTPWLQAQGECEVFAAGSVRQHMSD